MENQEGILSKANSILDKGKLFLKSVFIFFMALGLWIPTQFTQSLVNDRQERQQEAIRDISQKWGQSQWVTGPILSVPYLEYRAAPDGKTETLRRDAYFLADRMEASSEVVPEKRSRGIYQVVVYTSRISLRGEYKKIAWQELNVPIEQILWNEARVVFHVTDNLHGINEDVRLRWAGQEYTYEPLPDMNGQKDMLAVAVPVHPDTVDGGISFSMEFALNGSESLLFTPAARENKINMRSPWPDPKFTGVKLPDEKSVSDSGFSATWKYMNRSVPMVWKDKFYDLGNSAMGSDLILTVDGYDKTERSIKYALLCIVLTFAAFFLIETIYKKPLHFVQYALAGLALVLFYTLLLSLSEYLGFNLAYGLASVATIGLVTWFVGSIMKSTRLGTFIALVLGVVYAYIFTIIQMQDYALLMGSLGLFFALGVIMYFSRKIQW